MVSIHWIEKRKPHWERLEHLTARARMSLIQLNHAELRELGLLYRQTAADLATVHEDSTSTQLAAYLNRLLADGHNLIYLGRENSAGGIVHFYRDVYPRIFRETLPCTALATVLFFITAFGGWLLTLHDPSFANSILGPRMMDTIKHHEMWTHSVLAVKPLAASAIATNNLSVAFSMFALGITAIGTLWMTAFNGLMLGVVGAATWRADMALSLWSFVAPHGVLELPAIFIAAGAGLELARGWLFPGLLPRGESLAQAGSRASRLLLGVIPLLLVAGTIEGFFSPGSAPVAQKFVLAAVLFTALLLYLFKARSDP